MSVNTRTNPQEIHVNSSRLNIEETYHLPNLNEGLCAEEMIGRLSLVIQAITESEGIVDWDYRATETVVSMLIDVREQFEKYQEYREVVEEILLPTHNTLQSIGSEGRCIIEQLAEIDQDGLVKRKFLKEIFDIGLKRNPTRSEPK